MTTNIELTRLSEGWGLLEAARWYPEFGLVFSDMLAGGGLCVALTIGDV